MQPVTVQRDHQGVPHIDAATIDDLIAAQGYVAAQDRLWQMDMMRRVAAGEVAEVLGSKFVEHDRVQRVLEFRQTAERLTASLSPQDRRFFEDYARGVNAYISEADALACRVPSAQLPAAPLAARRLRAHRPQHGPDAR